MSLRTWASSLSNYLGDYSDPHLDHKKYEQDVVSAGAGSGPALYGYCISVIDREFDGKNPVRILDLACGRGPFGTLARQMNKSYLVDGIDIFVPEKDDMQRQGIYNKVIEADILKFDFKTIVGQYDIMVSNQFFEHLDPVDSIGLLKNLSYSGAGILISVPLSYQTFAYSKNYLLASMRENSEFSDLLSLVTDAEVHKTFFTKKMMKDLGFKAMPRPVFHSNFFYRAGSLGPIAGAFELSRYFKPVPEFKIDAALQKLYRQHVAERGHLPKREFYERRLMRALLREPKRYKVIRKLIYFVTNPVRMVKRML